MLDSTNENNNFPCTIHEVPSIKKIPKKKHYKNVMPGIPEVEEPYADEMEIKQQNQKPSNHDAEVIGQNAIKNIQAIQEKDEKD